MNHHAIGIGLTPTMMLVSKFTSIYYNLSTKISLLMPIGLWYPTVNGVSVRPLRFSYSFEVSGLNLRFLCSIILREYLKNE